MPSTTIAERFGMTLIEGNACGKPVITINSKMNATKDLIITGENGFICKLSNENIAKKIFMGVDRRKDMKQKCIGNAKQYDWNRLVNMIDSYYLEIGPR